MFVELFQGQVSDATELRAAFTRWAREVAPGPERPAVHRRDRVRERERNEPPPELNAEEMDALAVGEPEFFDMKQPGLYSAR
jgi:hypothetical protein